MVIYHFRAFHEPNPDFLTSMTSLTTELNIKHILYFPGMLRHKDQSSEWFIKPEIVSKARCLQSN